MAARALVEDWITSVVTADGASRVVPVPSSTVQVRQRGTSTLVTFPIYAAASGGSDLGPILTTDAKGVVRFYVDAANRGRLDLFSPATGQYAAATHADVAPQPAPDELVLYSNPVTQTIDGNVYTNAQLTSPQITTPALTGGTWASPPANVDNAGPFGVPWSVAVGPDTFLRVDANGEVWVGENVGVPAGHYTSPDSDDGIGAADGYYDRRHRRWFFRSAIIMEVGDPPEIALRRGGDSNYPNGPITQTLSGATLGLIYWQGSSNVGGHFNYRAAMLYARATQDVTSTSTGGEFIIATTANGGTAPTDAWSVGHDRIWRMRNAANNAWLDVLGNDGSNNLRIGRASGIGEIGLFRRVVFYDRTDLSTNRGQIDEEGYLGPDVATPAANYGARGSFLNAKGTVTESGGAFTLQTTNRLNAASVARPGAGQVVVTMSRAMADANYNVQVTPLGGAARLTSVSSKTTTTFQVNIFTDAGVASDTGFMFAVSGTQ